MCNRCVIDAQLMRFVQFRVSISPFLREFFSLVEEWLLRCLFYNFKPLDYQSVSNCPLFLIGEILAN